MTEIDDLQPIIDRYLRGEVSGPMAMMELVLQTEDVGAIADALPRLQGDPARLQELAGLLIANRQGCATIVEMLGAGLDSAEPAALVEEGIARTRRLFDDSVSRNEEASVALYSLGNPALLAEATEEVVRTFERWGVLGPDRDALEIGCGIGRFLDAMSSRLRAIVGTDVSEGMVAAASRRLGDRRNASARLTSGQDLGSFGDSSFDLVFSVDAFPYLVLSGRALVETHFREIQRVLRPGGDFVLFSYAYGRPREVDDAEVREIAAGAGLRVVRGDETPFTLWNGAGWHLVRDERP